MVQRNRWFGLALIADEGGSGMYRRLGLIVHRPLDRFDRDGELDILPDDAAQWFDGCEKVQLDIL